MKIYLNWKNFHLTLQLQSTIKKPTSLHFFCATPAWPSSSSTSGSIGMMADDVNDHFDNGLHLTSMKFVLPRDPGVPMQVHLPHFAWHYGRPCAAVGDSGTAAAATLLSLDAR